MAVRRAGRPPRMVAPVLLAAVLAACSPGPTPASSTDAGESTAISAAVAVVNAAAGSAVDQRAALATVTYPEGRPALDRCPDTTRTVRFEPVVTRAKAAAGFTDADGHVPPGTVLAVPTLVRVYADGALSTTEITLLHVGISDGTALFSPLCLG